MRGLQRINAVPIPDPFCMPLIDDILDNAGDCPYLSKLDLAKGFYQVPIQPDNKDKTAFCTPFGKIQVHSNAFWINECPSDISMHDVRSVRGSGGSFVCIHR